MLGRGQSEVPNRIAADNAQPSNLAGRDLSRKRCLPWIADGE